MLSPLRQGETLLGRANSCGIIIPSEKASRRHAKITVDGSKVYIEDLGSTNGVFVNEEQIASRTLLDLRDTVRIGDVTIRLVHLDEMKRTRRGDHPAPGALQHPRSSAAVATKQAHAFDVVGPLIEKMLTLGRRDEAERLLRTPLQRILAQVEEGGSIEESITSAAANYAVRVGEATGSPQWIDAVVRIHMLLARTLPIAVVDDLYRVLRNVKGIDCAALRQYVQRLESSSAVTAPTERFAIKRIHGLVRIASG